MSPSTLSVNPASSSVVIARSTAAQVPVDITAALNNALGITPTGGNKQKQAQNTPVAEPEKIESVTALEQAVRAGQVEWVKIRDGNELPNWQNEKPDIHIKFKVAKDFGGKEKEITVPNVFPQERLASFAVLCDEKGILKKEKPNPIIEELWDGVKQASPAIVGIALGGLGIAGIKSYSKYKFKKDVIRNLKTDPKSIWPSEKIKRGELKNRLVGMPEEVYTLDEKFWQYIDEHKNNLDAILLTDRSLSFFGLGHPGTGKTEFELYQSYHFLDQFNSKENPNNAAIVDLGEMMKDSSSGNDVIDALLKAFGIGEREKAKVIAEVLEKKKIKAARLRLDDTDMTSSKNLDSGLRIQKHLYDMVADAQAANTSVSQSRGFFLDMLSNIPFVGGFFKGIGGKPAKTSLRTVAVGITGNVKKKVDNAVEAARAQRVGNMIEFFDVTKERRALWIRNAIAEAYGIPETDVPIKLIAQLANWTHTADDELTYTPRSYRGDFMSTLKLFARPIAGNSSNNLQVLQNLERILTIQDANSLSPEERKAYMSISNGIQQVTSRAIPPINNIGDIDEFVDIIKAFSSLFSS